jgi:hypothetical protein
MIKLMDILLEAIEEEIKSKGVLSKGGHKYVYPVSDKYKSGQDISGNFVVKKWKDTEVTDGIVKREYDIYQKNKDMFAPIDRIDFKRRIIVQKKLDVGKAQMELGMLKKYLSPFYKDHEEFIYRELPAYFESLVEDDVEKDRVRATIKDSKALEVFDKWIDFTTDMLDMDRKYTDRFGKDRTLIPDYHDGNVGYDTDGKLKFLDI